MQRIIAPLTEMGASFDAAEGGRLPLTVTSRELRAIEHWQETASAQVKSAVLLAA
jgi:3-phosphoshikimate 1-carboxyvinyltransferase